MRSRPTCGAVPGSSGAAAVEQVRAHGGRHRRNASRDEGGFEQVLRPLSLPCTPARDDGASDALTEGCLTGSDLSADEVSDDGSTSLEDMSDGEILTSSPPLALPRPAPKSRGDPRLSLRLYKLVSRSVPSSAATLKVLKICRSTFLTSLGTQ
jgi:hypothetical protein